MNNKKGSISILSDGIQDIVARAEKAEAEVERWRASSDAYKAQNAAAEDRAIEAEGNCTKLNEEVEQWEIASGLNAGNDPNGVTPDMARQWWQRVERERDKARNEIVDLKRKLVIKKHNMDGWIKSNEEGHRICELMKKDRDEAQAEVIRLRGERDNCHFLVERWKRAVKGYQRMSATTSLSTAPLLGAIRAMNDGDLDALERAVGIKQK